MLMLEQQITKFLSTNLQQPYIQWVETSVYSVNDSVLFENHIYRSIVNNNIGVSPELNTGKWLLFGVDNAYASIDLHSSTKTICNADTIELDTGTYDLKLEFSSVGFTSLAFREIRGEKITITERDSVGTTIKETEYPIANYRTCADSWYNYYFCEIPAEGITDTVRDLFYSPINTQTASIKVVVTETVDKVSEIASMVGGKDLYIGDTQYGGKIGIIDYSKKETDDYGITKLVRRKSRETLNLEIVLGAIRTQTVKRAIKGVLGNVLMFIADETEHSKYEFLTILAYIDEFELNLNNGAISRGYILLSEVL